MRHRYGVHEVLDFGRGKGLSNNRFCNSHVEKDTHAIIKTRLSVLDNCGATINKNNSDSQSAESISARNWTLARSPTFIKGWLGGADGEAS
jgi:hypothetical protein